MENVNQIVDTEQEPSLFENDKLWDPPTPEQSQLWQFLLHINSTHHLSLNEYAALHKWSIEHTSPFWEAVWSFTRIKSSTPYTHVLTPNAPMFPTPSFFPGARLNFAENLLFPRTSPSIDPEAVAIIAATETTREQVTWSQLRGRVKVVQASFQARGLRPHDRVAGYIGNNVNAVVFMLAATSLGAIWTALSPDSGVAMALDRLKQIGPTLLVADASQEYNGKLHDVLGKVSEIVKGLTSLTTVVVTGSADGVMLEDLKPKKGDVWNLQKFLKLGDKSRQEEMRFEQLPQDHPVYILYSSGTTGAPKCIVHGAIGTLVQHKKEHVLQCDIRPGDRMFYYTTTTWMMWHWLVSGLASSCCIVLYDGSPMRYWSKSPPGTSEESNSTTVSTSNDLAMPLLLSELSVTHFGTSAKYLSTLEQKSLFPVHAPHNISLPHLRAIYNTASSLAPSTFRFVYRAFPSSIQLASITGGTDIISLFGAPSPISPIYAGEVQVPGLGMALRAFDSESDPDDAVDVTDSGRAGDLVCTVAFPCQPVGFWPLDERAVERYRDSYFKRFIIPSPSNQGQRQPIWHHGDYVAFNPQTGGLLMLGRSDGVLNPSGIRFGSAEIYNVLLKRFAGSVLDGLCVGRRREGEADETVVLFVKMEDGKEGEFGENLVKEIQKAIRFDLSPRHVPAVVDRCPDIPITVNGKKVEGAVKQILSGSKVSTSASVVNADCLEWYRQWASSHS